MLAHHQEQQRAVTVLEGEHRTALARAKALADAYIRLKQEAEENHPLDAAAKRAFEALSDDRCVDTESRGGGGGSSCQMMARWGGGEPREGAAAEGVLVGGVLFTDGWKRVGVH